MYVQEVVLYIWGAGSESQVCSGTRESFGTEWLQVKETKSVATVGGDEVTLPQSTFATPEVGLTL